MAILPVCSITQCTARPVSCACQELLERNGLVTPLHALLDAHIDRSYIAVAMPIEPFVSTPPLRFRAISDSLALSHLEGSECCLIHADNPLSKQDGVYLNPKVRVGYNPAAYEAVHPTGAWLSLQHVALALWENRLRRWFTTPFFKKLVVRKRIAGWHDDHIDEQEPGDFCLINEMQVLVSNGWAHV